MASTPFQKHSSKKAAFTLVELAIVMVIIGLLVSGILVGAEMIKNAEIRAFSTQLSKFNAATTTFRVKYGSLPGDIKGARATNFGLVTRSGAIGHGDGNGLIESCTASGRDLGCETALFWKDLSDASMIPHSLNGATDGYTDGTAPGFTLTNHLPAGNLRAGLYFFVYSFNAKNTYYVGGMSAISAAGVPTLSNGLTTREASDVDRKLDNGVPNSGSIRAVTSLTATDAGGAGISGDCVVNTTTPFSYNLSGSFADELNCRLIVNNAL